MAHEEVGAGRRHTAGVQVQAQGLRRREAARGLRGKARAGGALDVVVDGGDVVGLGQGVADGAVVQATVKVFGHVNLDADDGFSDGFAGNGLQDALRRVVAGANRDLYGDEGAGMDGLEAEVSQASALGELGVKVYHTEALVLLLLAEVHALEAAGVGDDGPLAEHLVLVDVAEGDVVQSRAGEGGEHEDGVAAKHHGALAAGGRAAYGDVADEDGGDVRVKGVKLQGEGLGEALLKSLSDLVQGKVAGVVAGEVLGAAYPGEADDLQRAALGRHDGDGELVGDEDALHVQRGEDLQGRGASGDGGQVVVAGEEVDGDAVAGEPGNAAGELALVGLGGVAGLVGVAGEEDGVYAFGEGVVHQLVVGGEEVQEARGEASLRVWAAVVLYAYVEISEVEETDTSPPGPLP